MATNRQHSNGGLLQGYNPRGTRLNTIFDDVLHLNFLLFLLFLSGVPAWRLVKVYSITVGFCPTLYC